MGPRLTWQGPKRLRWLGDEPPAEESVAPKDWTRMEILTALGLVLSTFAIVVAVR